MSKLGFAARVKARMKGAEETSILKLQIGTNKYLDKQVKNLQERIEENTEKIEEKQGELAEYLETPDLEQIKSTDERKAYIKDEYVAGYDAIADEIDELKELIERDEKIIKRRQLMVTDLNKETEA